jgi:hypothetical protein
MAIVPGTPFTDILSKEARAGVAAAVPSPSRLGRPAEYASLLREIVRNSMLNGVTIRLDGALRLTTRRRDVPTVSHETAGTGPSFRPPARF